MALEGSERKLLDAIVCEQGNAQAGYVEDSKIAEIADLSIGDVRDCLETLEGKEWVQRSIGVGGHSAYITAKGRQELRRSPVISGEERAESLLKVVPERLREDLARESRSAPPIVGSRDPDLYPGHGYGDRIRPASWSSEAPTPSQWRHRSRQCLDRC